MRAATVSSRAGAACFALFLALSARAQVGAPTVSGVFPNSAPAGQALLNISVSGANFQTNSTVYWHNTALATTFFSPSLLTASVPQFLLATPGVAQVSVATLGLRSLSVLFTVTAPPLSIKTGALPNAVAGTQYSFTFTANGGAPPYFWSAVNVLPPGLTLSGGGVLSGTPTQPGNYSFDVRVSAGTLAPASQTFQLTVSPPPLSVATNALPPASAGIAYTATLAASGGVPPYAWAATGLPAGLTLDAKTGVLSGAPTFKGTYVLALQVTDSAKAVGARQLTLQVNPPPLTITTTSPLFDAAVGSAYAQTFAAAGGTPPYTWSVLSGSTGDFILDAGSGALSGTPKTAGQLSFVLQVADSIGATSSSSFTVTVGAPKLVISTIPTLPGAKVGEPYSVTLLSSGGQDPLSWSVDAKLTAGLSLDASTGTISGTPTTPGTAAFVVQLRDGRGQVASKTFTLTTAPAALTLAQRDLPDALIGTPYRAAFTPAGGVTPYAWSANGLPDGLQLDVVTGALTGMPTSPGNFSFNVRVTDAARNVAITLFRLNVRMPALPAVSVQGLPAALDPATQATISLQLGDVYTAPVSGKLLLTFAPDSGPGDNTIQFSTGGRSASFNIPAGSTVFDLPGLALQSGTVAGTILVSASLQSLGADVTPTPAPAWSVRVNAGAPVIRNVKTTVNASAIQIQITGFSTTRELTEAKFSFAASQGSQLQVSDITVPLDKATSAWFSDSANAQYGSQFALTQTFNVQGSAAAVQLKSVTISNRSGSTSYSVGP